jgi:hypothetical protein
MIPEELRFNPYPFILDYYDSLYPITGRRLFSVLALMPPSLIMPKITCGDRLVRAKLHIMPLGNPGCGKTTISQEFARICYNPLQTESISPSRLYSEILERIDQNEKLTLIISDVAQIFSDESLIKIIEGVLEEGIISRSTQANKGDETRIPVDVCGWFSGTPENLSTKIREGLLFRALCITMVYTNEQHKKIISHVSQSMGNEGSQKSREMIKEFYDELWEIQQGSNEKILPIISYNIPEEFKQEITDFMNPLIENIFNKYSISFVRSVEDFYRVMCASAFLNIFSRKKIGGKLFIERTDLELAKKIIQRDIATKTIILRILEQHGTSKISQMLKEYEERREFLIKKAEDEKAKNL